MWCLDLSSCLTCFFSGASTSFPQEWLAGRGTPEQFVMEWFVLEGCEHHPPAPSMSQPQVIQDSPEFIGGFTLQSVCPSCAFHYLQLECLLYREYWCDFCIIIAYQTTYCKFRQLKHCTDFVCSQFPSHPRPPQPFWAEALQGLKNVGGNHRLAPKFMGKLEEGKKTIKCRFIIWNFQEIAVISMFWTGVTS